MINGVRSACLLLLLASVGFSSLQTADNGTATEEVDIPRTTASVSVASNANDIRTTGSAVGPPISISTCISRTVNYITHTLPQQCLRTDRISQNCTQASTVPSIEHTILSTGSLVPPETTQLPLNRSHALESKHTTNGSTSVDPAKLVEASNQPPTSVSAPTAANTAAVVVREPEVEADPLLDDASFLSFEEWKKQNLAKTGQSPDHVGQERPPSAERQRPDMHNALDTLGEESEIDLDFSGFGAGAAKPSGPGSSTSPASTAGGESTSPTHKLRSKDAGRTCKERTNYASFDCSANILRSNSECTSASSVLVENKDSYMLNTCAASNKFFIVELCNDIHIDTIVLANYEFFSSIFRHFRVSVSDRYPVKMEKWRELGTFEARNTREVQAFLVEDPQIWARYLRIEFLTQYGSEYYCPVSLLRVHGKTMMQEYRQEEEMARGELPDEEPALETETIADVAAQEDLTSTVEFEKPTIQDMRPRNVIPTKIADVVPNATAPANTSEGANPTDHSDAESKGFIKGPVLEATTCAPSSRVSDSSLDSILASSSNLNGSTEGSSAFSTTSSPTSMPGLSESIQVDSFTTQTNNTTQQHAASVRSTNSKCEDSPSAVATSTSALNPNGSASSVTEQAADSSSSISSSVIAAQSSNATRAAATASPSPQASSQESFFKSINKRLQQLESNSTLSLQYIEEQSRILRDAFSKVEKRQISTTSAFLSHLNDTVMTELHGFRQAYDQLWEGTVIELESQREQYQREMVALSGRLTLVADELVWQKRMGIVQSTLLLLCLGMVLFARQGNNYLDMTFAQQLMSKSQAALRAGWESEPNSPSPTSRSPVSSFRRKIWRSSTEPVNGGQTDESESRPQTREGAFEVEVQPPTPPSMVDDEEDDDSEFEDAPGTQSGPATPNGTGAGLKRPPGMPTGGRPSSPLRYQ